MAVTQYLIYFAIYFYAFIFANNNCAFAASDSKKKPSFDLESALRFEPYQNGVNAPVIQLDYEISEALIKVGNTELSEKTFKIFMGKPYTIDPKLKTSSDVGTSDIFLITIPTALFQNGSLEIISESGENVWSYQYGTSDARLGDKIKNIVFESILEKNNNLSTLIIPVSKKTISVLNGEKKDSFKFCLNQESGDYFSKICSPPYRMSQQTKKLKVQSQSTPNRVYINDKETELKGGVTVTLKEVIHFYASSSNQYSIEFKTTPSPLLLVDFFRDTSTNNIVLTGHTFKPTNINCKFLNAVDETSWLYRIGWIPTIGDVKIYWTLPLEPNNTLVYMMGEGGGQFTYKLNLDKAPKDTQKILLDKNTLKSTYDAEFEIYATAPPNSKVSSKQKSAKLLPAKKGRLIWNFDANAKGEEISKNILLQDGDENWIASHTVFRGYSSELSFRLAGALSANLQVNTMMELDYNKWFENFLGLTNSSFSQQRWGISFKTFRPLKTFKIKDSAAESITLNLTTLDLKYRFTPGLWERDETWGLILGYEDVKINVLAAPLIGGGFFWARSMPKIFDDIMNYFPFMSYPKWVDMDFIYYPVPLRKSISPGLNFAVNFHGKVLWSKTWFGEAGFGFKSYEYKDLSVKKYAGFQAFYGTVGLGINF